ncbi:MAG: response regulator transcription factor [Lachnospiraceae bacterium]|nr:response regulator transcription factor [Lachnospiraceae bacterium]
MARILIVEDEEKMARFVELELMHEGYETGKASDGRSGLEMALSGEYDLMVLDVMLPGLNGLEVLRRLRLTSSLPVILLTARDAVMDKVSGLEMGADDYMTKPFAIEELLARIRLALRKAGQSREKAAARELSCREVTLNLDSREVSVKGTPVELTSREFDLLKTFLENKNIVLSRDSLIEKVWGFSYFGETNVVDVYVRYLRQKIDDPFGIDLIHTVRGVGYVVKD